MGVIGFLLYLRYLFPGFPLHPLGFTIAANAITQNIVVSVFLIWAVKNLLMRLGGLERYRKTTPLFLGLFVGYLAGVSLGVLVDILFFHGEGHELITSF